MTPLLLRTSLRYLLRHPWQIGLSILGVALGVAVVVAIDLANGSAQRAFTLSTETITGRATHQIVGGANGLSEDVYRGLVVEHDVHPAAPVVTGYVEASGPHARPLQILGIDPFAEGPFRSFTGASLGNGDGDYVALLTEPGTAIISADTATALEVGQGGQVTIDHSGVVQQIKIIGIVKPQDTASQRALQGLVITDIATAQETLGMIGKLSSIDLVATLEQAQQIQSFLPAGAQLTTPATRSATITQLTRAFETNLTALSLLALLVGMFLIYNTITFSVVQRRSMFGTLRCLGVDQKQIFGLILLEAATVGVVGSVLGIALGIALGRGLVGLVTQTINDLYFVVTVRGLFLSPVTLAKGLLLGIVATLITAAVPAWEATTTPPRSVLRRSSIEERIRRAVPVVLGLGLLLIGLGIGLLLLPTRSLVVAFAALFGFVVGGALLTPAITVALMVLLRPIFGRMFGLLGRMAARDVVAALSRTSVAIAALMVAVSVTVGVGIMVGSFRQTVVTWLNMSLEADVYISPPGLAAGRTDIVMKPAAIEQLRLTPGVAGISTYRGVTSPSPSGEVHVLGLDLDSRAEGSYQFVKGDATTIWQGWQAGGALVSEPFAYKHNIPLQNGSVTLTTSKGEQRLPVVGVFYDYASEQGVVELTLPTFQHYYNDPDVTSMALYATAGTDVDQLVETLKQRVATTQSLLIRSNRGLREETLTIFDRTFAITSVLQLLATFIAFVGILSALMALQLERAKELGVLRANGLSPRQVWAVVLGQTGLMGLTAGLLSLPVGLTVAGVLVYVINKRSFGWTLNLVVRPSTFGQALLLALVAALLAGVYPAFRMSRTSPALALREE
ncbi:MAG: ABC transporter permease [Herpetosiphonaceae bacterium]|nr:ABC transporter permease [Herpetosiphonaceae bacterium]